MNEVIGRVATLLVALLYVAPVLSGHPTSSEMLHASRVLPSNISVPQIKLELLADKMDGFNLELILKNYELGPPNPINKTDSGVVEGHAHLYINGTKVQRVYGPYVHLPRHLFIDGVNKLSVSLNDHNHQAWQLNSGEDVMATLLIDSRKANFIKSHYSTSGVK